MYSGERKRMRKEIIYDRQELCRYIEAGKTNIQIADLMGVSKSTIAKWIKESGLIGMRFKTGKKKGPEVKKEDPAARRIFPSGHNKDRHLCRTCRFRAGSYQSTKYGCDYIFIIGHSRGCDAGDCNVYEKGKRMRSK